jgi:hypothetical protein
MSEVAAITSRTVDMAMLVDLEARWENLRLGPANQESTHHDLTRKQRAFDAFRLKLVDYNKKYPPGYVSAFHRNTPARLAAWLGKMRDLYRQAEPFAEVSSPVNLLEKAYRSADSIADKTGKVRFPRAAAVDTVKAAREELEALTRWCESVAA